MHAQVFQASSVRHSRGGPEPVRCSPPLVTRSLAFQSLHRLEIAKAIQTDKEMDEAPLFNVSPPLSPSLEAVCEEEEESGEEGEWIELKEGDFPFPLSLFLELSLYSNWGLTQKKKEDQ